MSEAAASFAIGAAMFAMMFGMGLTLMPADFRRVAKAPRATVLGTALQLIVMPLVALGIANAFDLAPLLTVGLVVIGACPGGLFSNMYIHFAKGNTALSITLTATATLATLFTLPLWVRFALSAVPGDASIDMPVLDTAVQLGGLTVLPVFLGMIARAYFPALASWERRLSLASAVVIVWGVVRQGASRPDPPIEEFMASLLPVACFSLAAIAIGIILPTLFGLRARDTVTIAVELVVKNTLLGIVLVGQSLDFEAMIPILAFALMQTPCGILILVGWRVLVRRGVLSDVPTEDDSDSAPAAA
ncbi:MAG: bile acid:sodium symporter family protein [Myxococcota bacterium]